MRTLLLPPPPFGLPSRPAKNLTDPNPPNTVELWTSFAQFEPGNYLKEKTQTWKDLDSIGLNFTHAQLARGVNTLKTTILCLWHVDWLTCPYCKISLVLLVVHSILHSYDYYLRTWHYIANFLPYKRPINDIYSSNWVFPFLKFSLSFVLNKKKSNITSCKYYRKISNTTGSVL